MSNCEFIVTGVLKDDTRLIRSKSGINIEEQLSMFYIISAFRQSATEFFQNLQIYFSFVLPIVFLLILRGCV